MRWCSFVPYFVCSVFSVHTFLSSCMKVTFGMTASPDLQNLKNIQFCVGLEREMNGKRRKNSGRDRERMRHTRGGEGRIKEEEMGRERDKQLFIISMLGGEGRTEGEEMERG